MGRPIKDQGSKFRKCSKCGQLKPRSIQYFVSQKNCIDGIGGVCRPCANKTQKARRNTTEQKEKRRLQWLSRKPKEVKRDKKRNKVAALKRWAVTPIKQRAHILLNGMRSRARKHNLEFDADFFTISCIEEQLINFPHCPCCGKKFRIEIPSQRKQQLKSGPANDSPSIDRMDISEGYTKENTALLCWRCNNLKRDATPDELEMVARWMRRKGLK